MSIQNNLIKKADKIYFQERVDYSPKDWRSAAYEYIAFKRDAEAEKEKMATRMAKDRMIFLKKIEQNGTGFRTDV